MILGPGPVLALVTGLVHTSIYVLVRGSAGGRLPILIASAFLGAWAGDAVGGRLDIDPVRIGDFHVISASVVAWLGLWIVGVLTVLGPDRRPAGRILERPTIHTSTAHPTAGQPAHPPHAHHTPEGLADHPGIAEKLGLLAGDAEDTMSHTEPEDDR